MPPNPPPHVFMNIFGIYIVAYSFTYTMVSAPFLRKVPIRRYQHLSTTTHTFVVTLYAGCTVQIKSSSPITICGIAGIPTQYHQQETRLKIVLMYLDIRG